jgi:hypothetical protein
MRFSCGGHFCRELVVQGKPLLLPQQRNFVAPPPEVGAIFSAYRFEPV